MKKLVLKILASIASLIGLMSVVTGIRVLTNTFDPGYITFPALITYNVIMGLISIMAGYLIWKNNKGAIRLSVYILIGHISVLLSLLTVFNDIVAEQSIKVMLFRSVIWVVIIMIVSKLTLSQTKRKG